jgi:hypothetical protein
MPYVFSGGDERPAVSGPLPEGDYSFVIEDFDMPYEKAESGNWVWPVRIKILPSNKIIYDYPWQGTDKTGNDRDGIGDLLLAVNRAPAQGKEPDWNSIRGARGTVTLKIEISQSGKLAGQEINRVKYYHKPKPLDMQAENRMQFKKEEVYPPKVEPPKPKAVPPSADEPDDIPF